MRGPLSISTIGLLLPEEKSSMRSAHGIGALRSGHVPLAVRATWRPPGRTIALAAPLTSRTAELELLIVSRPSYSMNSGSSLISAGEMVVKSLVAYVHLANSASAWRAGSMIRVESAAANAALFHFA